MFNIFEHLLTFISNLFNFVYQFIQMIFNFLSLIPYGFSHLSTLTDVLPEFIRTACFAILLIYVLRLVVNR